MSYFIEDLMIQEMIKHPGFKYLLPEDPKLVGLPPPVLEVDLTKISIQFYQTGAKPRRDMEATVSMAKITLNAAVLTALMENPKEEEKSRYGCCGFMGLLNSEDKKDQINRYYVSDQKIWDKDVIYHNGGLLWVEDRKLKVHLN